MTPRSLTGMSPGDVFAAAAATLRAMPFEERYGTIVSARGALIEVDGLAGAAQIGSRIRIAARRGMLEAEVTGLESGLAQCLPFSEPQGLYAGARAVLSAGEFSVRPDASWLGRMVDGLGRPVDGKGALPQGLVARAIRATPPPAAARARVGGKLETGVRALDVFAPLCEGQRLGLFAGSGVGKSVLLSMLARWTKCDVAVIGLIGERGREVQEFVEDDLGPEGLARSVVVVATSDEPALMRRQAAWTTLSIAEHFRDQGLNVLCLMDSVTRFAMAQREIGLASGEPPATKGYPPTVFAELPRLLERAGPGTAGQGSITGLFTVLVDGDDHNEPVADAVRGILDGHVVITRKIAERGRYPAIDVLKSVSRTLPHCHSTAENATRLAARRVLSTYGDMEEMVRLGAYQAGASPEVDAAIRLAPAIETLLTQNKQDRGAAADTFATLDTMLTTDLAATGAGGVNTPYDTALRVAERRLDKVRAEMARTVTHLRALECEDDEAAAALKRECVLAMDDPRLTTEHYFTRARDRRAHLMAMREATHARLEALRDKAVAHYAERIAIDTAIAGYCDTAERTAAAAEQAAIDDLTGARFRRPATRRTSSRGAVQR